MNNSKLQTIEEIEPRAAVSVSILKEKFLDNPDQAKKPEAKVDYNSILRDLENLKKKESAFEEKERAFAKDEQSFKAEVKKLRQREITIKQEETTMRNKESLIKKKEEDLYKEVEALKRQLIKELSIVKN